MIDNNNCYKFKELIDRSIQLELLVSELYFIFYTSFPQDSAFWWKLVEEEKNHAALLRSGCEYFESNIEFPVRILTENISELSSSIAMLKKLITICKTSPPSREMAFNYAYVIETSAGELHFQHFMENTASMTPIEKIFSQLNQDDVNHAERIHLYMKSHDIPTLENTSL